MTARKILFEKAEIIHRTAWLPAMAACLLFSFPLLPQDSWGQGKTDRIPIQKPSGQPAPKATEKKEVKETPGKNEKRYNFNRNTSDDIKTTLMNKYKEMFVDKLTQQDLRELQFYLKNQFNENRQLNTEYKLKFESRLRQYFHEEVLRREIISIETLLGLLTPEDVKDQE